MAACPLILRRGFTCCRKFSCLLDVVTQKSDRIYVCVSLDVCPSLSTIVILLFLPKGGLVKTISYRSPGPEAKLSKPPSMGLSSLPMPCKRYQLETGLPGSTDAARIALTRGWRAQWRHLLPTRYIHSPVSPLSLEDAENAVQLACAAVASLARGG